MISDFSLWPALSMKERLSTLEKLLDYWFENKDYNARVKNIDLPGIFPEPVKWLYSVIKKYNIHAYEQGYGDWTDGSPVIVFHSIKKPSSLSYEKGFCEFLNENQGVYQCAIKNDHADDPPIYKIDSQNGEWIKIADRFSDFLLFLLVFELVSGSASSYILGSIENYTGSGLFISPTIRKLDQTFIHIKTDFILWPLSGDAVSIYVSMDAALISVKNEDDYIYIYAVAKNNEKVALFHELGEWEFDFT